MLINTAYIFQSALIFLWWIAISVSGEVYGIFSYSSINREAFFNLLVPDLILLGLLSLIRSYVTSRDLGLIILGAFAYATLFCINASISGLDGVVPTLTMVFGLIFNIFLVYPFAFMRSASSRSVWVNGLKTLVQIVSFWSIFLGILPFILLWATQRLADFEVALPVPTGILFLLFSLLGLSSAYFMVSWGEGTPLPLDATNKLVLRGPYAFIRNPMAVAGVGQILSLALFFGSWPIAIYGVVGGLAWHFIIRPIEENDLSRKFGAEYESYRSRVRCWIPRPRL